MKENLRKQSKGRILKVNQNFNIS